MNMLINAVVFRNEQGFFARAIEVPVISTPAARTQRGALRNLEVALGFWVTDWSVEGRLASSLEEAGFRGAVDSSNLEVHLYDRKSISVPIPANWLRKKEVKPQFKDVMTDGQVRIRGGTTA